MYKFIAIVDSATSESQKKHQQGAVIELVSTNNELYYRAPHVNGSLLEKSLKPCVATGKLNTSLLKTCWSSST